MYSSSNHSSGPLSSGQDRTSCRSGSRVVGSPSFRSGRESGVGRNQFLPLGYVGRTALGGPRLHVEAQQRFGVGGADVVPPVSVLDGEPVQPVDGGAGLGLVRSNGL